MPRSGTKLLRALLSNHPKISILSIETEFLPYWERHWSNWGGEDNLAKYTYFFEFYQHVIKFPYFIYMKNLNMLIPPEHWYKGCYDFSVSGVFEALARHDASADDSMIWGDKSPSYIRHIPLLKVLFPEAKIIHIIRDVRDYCLSMNKAWGKNMLRAAQRWSKYVSKAREDGINFNGDYIEMRYEDLLAEPESQLSNLCSFLGLEYYSCMLDFARPSENLGDTRQQAAIIRNNTNKYLTRMNLKLRKKIEQISFPLLLNLGYQTDTYNKIRKTGKLEEKIYQLFDGIQLIRSSRKNHDWGFIKATIFHIKAFLQSRVKV